jgi:hypothetical protein
MELKEVKVTREIKVILDLQDLLQDLRDLLDLNLQVL